MLLPLELLGCGECAVVEDVQGEPAWVGRMAEMGVRSGCLLQMLQPGSTVMIYIAGEVQRYWAEGVRTFVLRRCSPEQRALASQAAAALAAMHKAAVPGAYVSESNYFEADWQRAFWGANYPRLRAVKDKYDPGGLFFVHHGVGSEDWSADGFSRRH